MPRALLRHLLDPACSVHGDLAQVDGLLRTDARWDTGITRLREHLCYYLLSGDAVLEVAGTSRSLGTDALLLVPPAVAFRVRAGRRPPRVLRLRFVIADGARSRSWTAAPQVIPEAQPLLPIISGLVRELSQPSPAEVHAARVRAGLILLLTQVPQARPRAAAAASVTAAQAPGGLTPTQLIRLQALLDGIGADAGAGGDERAALLTPRDLARGLDLSLDYATRRIRHTLGASPRALLVRVRLRAAAARLMQDQAPIAEVAQALGWRDVNLFTRQFRRQFGQPPGRWRQERQRLGPAATA